MLQTSPTLSPAPQAMGEPVSLADQITCVRREIAMRARVYPRWVALKRMTREDANEEIARMKAVLATLEGLRAAITKAEARHV